MQEIFEESKLRKQIKYIGIPILGILLSLIANENYELFSSDHLMNSAVTIIITATYWMSCNKIVVWLWHKYPWHIQPLKHLLVEIALLILLFIVITSLTSLAYMFEPSVASICSSGIKYQFALIITIIFFLTTFHEAIFFYRQWQEHFKKSAILEKSSIEAQYSVLKTQVNPHFLFNSLNTLITYVDGNKLASNYIKNMSDFLRYTLNSNETELKTLEEEISIVEKYFYLQKSRFGDNICLNISINENDKHFFIPTLSLQMLIENAIKHNIISTKKPLNINVFIKNKEFIVVSNNLQKRLDVKSTKQGLNNITDRYKFLSNKNVSIEENTETFIVELPLLNIK